MTEPHPQSDPARRSGSQPSWYGGEAPASASGHGSSTGGWPDASEAPSYSEQAQATSVPYGQGAPAPGFGGAGPSAPAGPAYAQSGPAYAQPAPVYGYAGQPLAPGQSAGTGLSVSSLVIGILSLIGGFGLLFPPIVGVVLGHLARRREPNGRGMALAGLIMNYISLAIVVLMVVAVILFVIMGMSLDAVYNEGVTGLNS